MDTVIPNRKVTTLPLLQLEKDARTSMLHEANIMSFYSHENVIQVYGSYRNLVVIVN